MMMLYSTSFMSWLVVMIVVIAVINVEAQSQGNTSNQTISTNSTIDGYEGRFTCVNSSLTFDIDDVCDGQYQCPYSDDEYICDNEYCSSAEYMCDYEDSYECIPLDYVCDGYADCEQNGIDEILCDPLDCVPSCRCSAYSVSCEGRNIVDDTNITKSSRDLYFIGQWINGTKMPLSMPFNVTTYPLLLRLRIYNTGLRELLRADFLTLTEIRIMILQYNNISRIEDLSFSNLNKLTMLDLSYNSITRIEDFSFRDLNKLTTLYLSRNVIESLSSDTFSGLTSLTKMDLSHNVIRSLSNDTFIGLTSLTTIDLSYNSITRIEDFSFRDLNKLTSLYLSRNVIESLSSDTFSGLTSLTEIDLRFNRIAVLPARVFKAFHLEDLLIDHAGIIELEPGCFQGLEALQNLVLYRNSITSLPSGVFRGLESIIYLHLFDNKISNIDVDVFKGLNTLEFLDLTNNSIIELRKGLFEDQSNLTWVSFSDNPLEYIEPGTFQNLSRLEYLNMVNVQLTNLEPDTFKGITSLEGLSTDDYRLCCLFDETDLCTIASSNFLDSCSRLMPNTILRVALWVIGFGALIGNTIVLVFRCRTDHSVSAKTQGLFISNLAIADFLMGIYMLIISSADVYYGEYFYLYAEQWRGSVTCKVAGFIAFLSSETSVFILAIITIDRVLCVVFPFGKLKFRATSARVGVALIWAIAFVVSIVPLIVSSYISGFYGLSDVCVGLPLNVESTETGELVFNIERRVWEYLQYETTKRPSWVYSIAIFLGVNFLIFILILLSYVVIFVHVRKSARSVANPASGSVSSDRAREVKLATRMSIIVLTDFFCWMPVIIMGILSQTGAVTLPVSLYAWSVVFILPINATINPYLYTFIAICGGSKTRSTSNPTQKTTVSETRA
ncbi:relaxin receptor 2 isoform X2 [Strongylocentrotus purpuratus]|uniref:G-protein coupled receptors family 1 profile domain-containing protein n=1 Tax=Strongylocentrotus purpuratus TaxID=7668 RepID=A0A7M7P7R4_STRPU|nr:relaxin receptor 2 isoform X2 [Strongylocentrotus purpuratus]